MAIVEYLGHASFRIFSDNHVEMLIDPWITGNKGCKVSVDDLLDADLIMVTHGAFDHLGDTLEIAKKSNAQVFCCPAVRNHLINSGLLESRITGAVYGYELKWKTLKVKVLDAKHISFFKSEGQYITGIPLSYFLYFEGGGNIYYLGDTSLFGDMKIYREIYNPLVGIVPIGGVGNWGAELPPREAAIASKWLGLKKIIPMHYGMDFDRVEEFNWEMSKIYPEGAVVVLKPGEKIEI